MHVFSGRLNQLGPVVYKNTGGDDGEACSPPTSGHSRSTFSRKVAEEKQVNFRRKVLFCAACDDAPPL